MSRRTSRAPIALLALAASLLSCDKPTNPDGTATTVPPHSASDTELSASSAETDDASAVRTPFESGQLFFEFNSSANDLGVQVFVDAEEWRRVHLIDPQGHEILSIQSSGRMRQLGLSELHIESAEPTPAEALPLFPEGEYRFRGQSLTGEQLGNNVVLSHHLPSPPTFSPTGGAVVDRNNTVVEWNAPGGRQVEVIIENDELAQVFDVTLAASVRRLKVSPQFLTPGREYKIEVVSIAASHNQTLTEGTFRVAE